MSTLVVIQARTGWTRLPGQVYEDLVGERLLRFAIPAPRKQRLERSGTVRTGAE